MTHEPNGSEAIQHVLDIRYRCTAIGSGGVFAVIHYLNLREVLVEWRVTEIAKTLFMHFVANLKIENDEVSRCKYICLTRGHTDTCFIVFCAWAFISAFYERNESAWERRIALCKSNQQQQQQWNISFSGKCDRILEPDCAMYASLKLILKSVFTLIHSCMFV